MIIHTLSSARVHDGGANFFYKKGKFISGKFPMHRKNRVKKHLLEFYKNLYT